ncbi:uncharacterized protein LOC103518236 isoform X2 [Diaphorina citri]|uniref:Uncharacterized protein LOC103518236 isoform X2 n=1 Tax=Diaphorina citri TaxID=121845 RepID=A0A1S3DI74_DIACI|nr:uncharacterized protein LOC103518236 isoform X2 [Diaphorina citri]KAI5710268.1 hypothetical protein M8J75_007150 [Diaphorina citri]
MSLYALLGDVAFLNEENTYYSMGKEIFVQFSDTTRKSPSEELTMSISGLYKFLRKIDLLDEVVMTALELDVLFNEYNVEYITFDQFMSMMEKFAIKKMLDFNLLMRFIIQQVHSLSTIDSDKSEDGQSTISSSSDVSNAYTYYPRHDPRYKCLDELSSSDDGHEEKEEKPVDEDADDLHPASLPSVTATSTTIADGDAYRYEDFENENDEDEYLYGGGSRTQFEIFPQRTRGSPSSPTSYGQRSERDLD